MRCTRQRHLLGSCKDLLHISRVVRNSSERIHNLIYKETQEDVDDGSVGMRILHLVQLRLEEKFKTYGNAFRFFDKNKVSLD